MSATKLRIRVGHSPDPDDAFMFHALANAKIDTGAYEFTHELVDIETLNRRAFAGELELTAVSLHAYAYLTDKYMLCTCGASMGDGYGPMVVGHGGCSLEDLRDKSIAVPGTLTTAYLALRLCLGRDFRHDFVVDHVDRFADPDDAFHALAAGLAALRGAQLRPEHHDLDLARPRRDVPGQPALGDRKSVV